MYLDGGDVLVIAKGAMLVGIEGGGGRPAALEHPAASRAMNRRSPVGRYDEWEEAP
jgi:hypothetical protein